MKLELKHLAPYLPYGLKIEINNYKQDYVGLRMAKITGYYFMNFEPYFTYEGGATGKSFKSFKPILRPLSDLAKEIEINGASFIPITTYVYYNIEMDSIIGLNKTQINTPYGLMKYLFEWHFDVFGLIENNLAIDINTLNQ
jgi:hypothetical protein